MKQPVLTMARVASVFGLAMMAMADSTAPRFVSVILTDDGHGKCKDEVEPRGAYLEKHKKDSILWQIVNDCKTMDITFVDKALKPLQDGKPVTNCHITPDVLNFNIGKTFPVMKDKSAYVYCFVHDQAVETSYRYYIQGSELSAEMGSQREENVKPRSHELDIGVLP